MTSNLTQKEGILDALRIGLNRVKKGWCQHRPARCHTGLTVGSESPEAIRWCAEYALPGALPVSGDNSYLARHLLFEEIKRFNKQAFSITSWNDRQQRHQKDIVRLYERTIKRFAEGTLILPVEPIW